MISKEQSINTQKNKEISQEKTQFVAQDDDILFEKNSKKTKYESSRVPKKYIVFLIIGILGLCGSIACIVIALLTNHEAGSSTFSALPSTSSDDASRYSLLTGEALADDMSQDAPVYCIQTPNGTDGARPQSGLTDAGVVFEAIAEAGITRFAAIYQNPTPAVIGPVRSLRIYYLQWDTPFDCTIVHAGGADNALEAVATGGYKDLSEDYNYMYRGTYSNRLWNNLFTTSTYLKKFSTDHGYNTSNIKGFKRMTPDESGMARVDAGVNEKLDITKPASSNTSEVASSVNNINLYIGGVSDFNVQYSYDPATNTYNRNYESGAAHEVYECANEDLGEKNPEDVCTLTQISPSVVIAMIVQEGKAADGYHEDITTVGSGKAYIFQNGAAIAGTWSKTSIDEQIKFTDDSGAEIALAPGQTFITAVPAYGSVEY